MLSELTVRNFALIDELHLQLKPGYTVLTGETGAGKSIIVDALNAALGERVSSEVIRGGADTSVTEAVFEAGDAARATAVLAENGLTEDDSSIIILSREISAGGSRYRVNRRVSTLSLLSEISRHLADIHGQHQHQSLIHEENHLHYLDQYGARAHLQLVGRYREKYNEFAAAKAELRSLQMDEQERSRRLDMLRFQIQEIGSAALQPGEEEELTARRQVLQAGEKLLTTLAEVNGLLAGGEDTALGAKDALQEAANRLSTVGDVDPRLAAAAGELERLAYQADDAARTLGDYLDTVEMDPALLDGVEARLDLIAGLKRKYGASVGEILEFLQNVSAEAERLCGSTERLGELEQLVKRLAVEAGEVAGELSQARRALADELAEGVVEELSQLGMPGAQFDVEFATTHDPEGVALPDGRHLQAGPTGVDEVHFALSANPGEPLKPLAKVASGGELSRLMLALKSLCARGAEVPTIVFDEIDVGIGGVTAQRIGEKLLALAQHAQVLCVTHLPQVANFADQHLVVDKEVAGGRTKTVVRELTEQERAAEVARMYGDKNGKAAMEHAEQALAEAGRLRAELRAQNETLQRD